MPNQKNDNNDSKNDMSQDAQRQRTAQPGGADKQAPRGVPAAGNRDNESGGKMPQDKTTPGNDMQDVEVGDDRSPQRAPQRGAGKPDLSQK
ncbi:MAG: hypothetical protein H7138_12905 [Myxococcales bacterium]|nr:hypothetical protein [Myxococcales bacterium]